MRQVVGLCMHGHIYREALCGSAVVRCVEGTEAVFKLDGGRTDSEEEDERECCVSSGLVECVYESWD